MELSIQERLKDLRVDSAFLCQHTQIHITRLHQILNTFDRIHENSSHLFSSKLFQQPRIFAQEI